MLKTITVDENSEGIRLDKYLGTAFDFLSRTKISRLIVEGKVTVDEKIKKASYRLHLNEIINIDIPKDEPCKLLPFALEIPILYEDDSLIIIDKPSGITTHPPHKSINDTLVNALIYMGKELAPINPLRPGIVHRLDRETSGVMMIAKTNKVYLTLTNHFRRRLIFKEYRAICWGVPIKDDMSVELPMARDQKNRMRMKVTFVGAKNASTKISVIERFKDSSYISINIATGRMHQIRVHMKFLDLPIVGDKKYGRKDGFDDFFLHAHTLVFYHPETNERLEFTAEIPKRFTDYIEGATSNDPVPDGNL